MFVQEKAAGNYGPLRGRELEDKATTSKGGIWLYTRVICFVWILLTCECDAL